MSLVQSTGRGTIYQFPTYIAVEFTQIESLSAISINYRGAILAESKLPTDWQLFANDNRIICISSKGTIPDMIIKYTGKFELVGGTAITKNNERLPLEVQVSGVDYWDNIRRVWRIAGDKATYGDYHGKLNTKKFPETIITRNRLYSNGEYFLSNGASYVGAYHQHQDGSIMTDQKHTMSSKMLYRKDLNGNLYSPSVGKKSTLIGSDNTLDRHRENSKHYMRGLELLKVGALSPAGSVPVKKSRSGSGSGGGSGGTTL